MITADLVDEQRPWRHDPRKLARALMTRYEQQEETQRGGLFDENRPGGYDKNDRYD
jgi:hypothetical protein